MSMQLATMDDPPKRTQKKAPLAVVPKADDPAVMAIPIKKFSMADLEVWGPPMIGRLKSEHPYRTENSWLGHIHQWMASPRHIFIRTDCALGLATIASGELDPRPYVDVLILWFNQDKESKQSAVRLCREFERWCKAMKALHVSYSGSVDFQHNDMVDLVGIETGRTIYYKSMA